jgi:hypothetical protein
MKISHTFQKVTQMASEDPARKAIREACARTFGPAVYKAMVEGRITLPRMVRMVSQEMFLYPEKYPAEDVETIRLALLREDETGLLT